MTATSPLQLRTMLTEIGFEVTVLEDDYSLIRMPTADSFNAMLVASKPIV